MSLEQMYQNRRAQIIERNVEALVKANGTAAQIISDGESQLVIARQDETELTAAGMDPALITEVEEVLWAYSWLAGLCETETVAHHADKDIYTQLITTAYAVRKYLFSFGKFGVKKNGLSAVEKELKEIIDGFGEDDLIFDMLKLNQLFTANPTITDGLLLFDSGKVDEALAIHNQLRSLRAEVKNPVVQTKIAQLEREVRQAYDLYHEKVYELRDWGAFVFEGQERAEEYKSEYITRRYE